MYIIKIRIVILTQHQSKISCTVKDMSENYIGFFVMIFLIIVLKEINYSIKYFPSDYNL